MDSTKDCFIKLGNSVYYKEYNPFIIFQFIKEYGDKAVTNQITRYMLLEKDIRFIQ
jgi:hypothetical protein